jgi:hypothetical protein
VFTRACHWSLSWARLIQPIPPHSFSIRRILISSSHWRIGPPSVLLQAFPPKPCLEFFSLPCVLHAQPNSSSLIWSFWFYLAKGRFYAPPSHYFIPLEF